MRMVVSSLNLIKFPSVSDAFISFTYIKNKIGPIIEPCGTPSSTDLTSEILFQVSYLCPNLLKQKAAGPDGLKPFVLRELPLNKLEKLLFIYKTMILLQFTPSHLTKYKIIWIPKPGKDTYKVPTAMSLIQRISDQLVTLGGKMGLTFNPTKTV